MLLWLSQWLKASWPTLDVVHYLTLRMILSAITAFIIAIGVGPALIRFLKRYKVGQPIRDDGPQTHITKTGTPTMGGVLIIIALTISTLLWADLSSTYVWIIMATLWMFGAIGFVDDYRKLILKNPKGLPSRWKYCWQTVAGFIIAYLLYAVADQPEQTTLIVPFFKHIALPLGLWFIVLSYFVIVGSSNAVNLTDGLDGLAIVPIMQCSIALGVFAYVVGHGEFAHYLHFPHIKATSELVVFCAAMAGAGMGFLWFNCYPAQIFMGDVGSLSLGAVLGVLAVMVRQELLLVLMGAIFVVETLSVILQVASFKLRGKRIFKMAPIHHHFELLGWPETKVIVRFWIMSLICVLLSLATLKLR